MKMLSWITLCTAAILILGCGDEADPSGPGSEVVGDTEVFSSTDDPSELTGRVVDPEGRPLAAVNVSLSLPGEGRGTFRPTETDVDGRYRVRGLTLGRTVIRWKRRQVHEVWVALAHIEIDRRASIELEDQSFEDSDLPLRLIIRDENGQAIRARIDAQETSRPQHRYLFDEWFDGKCVIHGLSSAATYRFVIQKAGYQMRTLHLQPVKVERGKVKSDRFIVPGDDLGSATITHGEASATLELVMKAHRKDPRQVTISLSGSAPEADFVATVYKMSDSKKLPPLRVAMAEGAWPPEFELLPGRYFIDVFAPATSTPDSRRPARFFAREFEVVAGENASIPVDWEDGVLIAGRIESKEGQSPSRMSRLITDTEGPLSSGASEFDFKGGFEIWVAPTRRLRLHVSFGSRDRIMRLNSATLRKLASTSAPCADSDADGEISFAISPEPPSRLVQRLNCRK